MEQRKKGRPKSDLRKIDIPGYHSWKNMRLRCNYPGHSAYPYYGGRGIKVCERWESFDNFIADMGHRPAGASLDRIDTNGHYEPGNCKWSNHESQMKNRRFAVTVQDLDGSEINVTDFCKKYGLLRKTVAYRIQKGIPLIQGRYAKRKSA